MPSHQDGKLLISSHAEIASSSNPIHCLCVLQGKVFNSHANIRLINWGENILKAQAMFLISIKVEFSRGLQGTDAIKETNTYLLPCANQCGSLKSYFICLSLEGLNRMNSELVDSHKTWEDFINNYNSSFFKQLLICCIIFLINHITGMMSAYICIICISPLGFCKEQTS